MTDGAFESQNGFREIKEDRQDVHRLGGPIRFPNISEKAAYIGCKSIKIGQYGGAVVPAEKTLLPKDHQSIKVK